MMRSIRMPARRRRAWALSLSTLAFAGASMVLLPEPEADAPHDGDVAVADALAALVPVDVSGPVESGEARPSVALHGPGLDGAFALATGAVRADQASELLAELRLTGVGAETTHVPVSLAVVLDHSGSMSGEKISAARQSIVSLLAAMDDDDRLAVIVYDDQADVLQPLAPARVLRRSLADRVMRVTADGGTDIPAGLRLGIDALREAPEGTARRIILISDGRDGSGLSLGELAAQVGRSAEAQVVTSSLGVGIDYDQNFMTAVADAGHGNYAFLEHGSMLEAFLRRELDESSRTVAENVIAEVRLPSHVHLVAAHGAVARMVDGAVHVELGTLFGGERRKVVFELEANGAPLGAGLALPVRVSYRAVSEEGTAQLTEGTAVARVVGTDEEVEAAKDPELYADAVATVLDAQQNQAMAAWRAGDRESARSTSVAALHRYRSVAARHPSPALTARMEAVEAEMDRYDSTDPLSAEGRSFDLGSGASRREAASVF